MKISISDIETERLDNPEKLWLFGGMDPETGEITRFEPFRGEAERKRAIEWAESIDLWVGHNFLSFDMPNTNRLLGKEVIRRERVIDTLIVSRLIKYDRITPKGCKSGHSLKAHGIRLKTHKGDFDHFEDFLDHWDEGVAYWEQDLHTTLALYNDLKRYIWDPQWKKSLRCEHDLQWELDRQSDYGFLFNKEEAAKLLAEVTEEKEALEKEIQADYPPKLVPVNYIQYRTKKETGEEYATVTKAKEKYPMTKVIDGDLVCYDYKEFNPGSPKDRIEALWEAGWKPFEKTKTHQQFDRTKPGDKWGSVKKMSQEFYDEKKEHFQFYGWTCGEDNLSTLPAKAPKAAKKLAQWLTLEGRRSSLVEWIGQTKDDGRIHGNVTHIGAWTGRCAHSNPNTANISAVWPEKKKPANEVEKIKQKYDTRMRSLWCVPEGHWLVGVDAEGIQLRILGDQIWRHCDERSYADTIVNGNKEDETDIHNVNKRALGLNRVGRDEAKTFVYAWILNAGIPKIASILKTEIPIASQARNRFESSIPGLHQFKNEVLPFIANQGWFTGYDGRKVIVPNLHKTLAGILQNGEKVVMAHSRLMWTKELKGDMINFHPVGFIHDENQTEVIGTREEAEHVKEVQINAIVKTGVELGFLCPLAGSGSVGKDWSQTH